MLLRSRKSCMMPLGTPPGIFVRTLRARLSWTSPFRSLKVFAPRSLSDSWETRDENPQFRVTKFKSNERSVQNELLEEKALPGCCTGQALSGLSFCWRHLQGSWKWRSCWGGAVLGLLGDLKVSPSAGFSPSTGKAVMGSSETPASGCCREPSQWIWQKINKPMQTDWGGSLTCLFILWIRLLDKLIQRTSVALLNASSVTSVMKLFCRYK